MRYLVSLILLLLGLPLPGCSDADDSRSSIDMNIAGSPWHSDERYGDFIIQYQEFSPMGGWIFAIGLLNDSLSVVELTFGYPYEPLPQTFMIDTSYLSPVSIHFSVRLNSIWKDYQCNSGQLTIQKFNSPGPDKHNFSKGLFAGTIHNKADHSDSLVITNGKFRIFY